MKHKFDSEKLMKKFSRRHTGKYGVVENNRVLQFVREYSFLSNFYPVEITIEGMVFPTVENAYQAMKFPKRYWNNFTDIMPGKAKKLSRELIKKVVADGDDEAEEQFYKFEFKKVEIMRNLLTCKFKNEVLKQKLVETGNLILIEGNTWGDVFWGVNLNKPADNEWGFEGQNMLGRLLMELRGSMQ